MLMQEAVESVSIHKQNDVHLRIWPELGLFLLSNLPLFTLLNCLKPHLVCAAQMPADDNGAIKDGGGIIGQYVVQYNAACQENTLGRAAILNIGTIPRALAKNRIYDGKK
jgi:hypothetical protein